MFVNVNGQVLEISRKYFMIESIVGFDYNLPEYVMNIYYAKIW